MTDVTSQPNHVPLHGGDGSAEPRLSIIVPAYNEELLLPRTLQAINDTVASLAISAEVIVANDASTDRTPEIAQEYGARLVNLENRQIAATRNGGAAVARAERLLFVDADTVVNPTVMRAMLAAFDEGAVAGGAKIRFDENVGWLVSLFVSFVETVLLTLLKYAPGCFLFSRRDAFEKVGGFDEVYFACEEIHLSRALKRQGKFVILRERVVTSARKARFNGQLSLLWRVFTLTLKGPGAMKRREALGLWYDGQRE